jgi:hypothetical protein
MIYPFSSTYVVKITQNSCCISSSLLTMYLRLQIFIHFSKRRGQKEEIPASCSGGLGCESQPEDRVS